MFQSSGYKRFLSHVFWSVFFANVGYILCDNFEGYNTEEFSLMLSFGHQCQLYLSLVNVGYTLLCSPFCVEGVTVVAETTTNLGLLLSLRLKSSRFFLHMIR